jgi:polyphenol oxidase
VFCFHDTDGTVGVAFTDRHGGVSAPPFDSLNLGTGTADDPASVSRNYELVGSALGEGAAEMALMRQVHGTDVAVVRDAPPLTEPPKADRPGVVLSVRVADCVPVLLADTSAGVVGCAHAGRAGLAGGVVTEAVRAMRELGARRVRAWVGPHVCGGCYEVPEAMRDEVAAVVPQAWASTTWGTPSLDLGAGVKAQLRDIGCVVAQTPRRCTREDPDLYSHRRDGERAGRCAGLVWLRS